MSVKHQTKDLCTTKGSYNDNNDNAHMDQDSKLHHEQYPHMYYPPSLTCANFQSGIHESRSNCRVFVSTCQNIFHPPDWHFASKIVLCAHAADPVGALQTHDVTVVGPHDPIEQFVRVLPRLLADGFQHGGVLGTHQLLHGRQCCGRVAQVQGGISM